MLIEISSCFFLCKYSFAETALKVFLNSKVCLQILKSSQTCLKSFNILSTDQSIFSISIMAEQTTFYEFMLHTFNDLTSLISLIVLTDFMNLSLSNFKGVWFDKTLMHSLAIGTVVKITRIENKKVHIGSIIVQFV